MIPPPYKLLALACSLVLSFSAGWHKSTQWHEAKAAKAALVASEKAREQEQANALKQSQKLSEYATRLKREAGAAAAARSDLQRLRDSLTRTDPAPSDSCDAERARVRVLSDLLSEGASLVEEGGRHVEQLRADKQALKD